MKRLGWVLLGILVVLIVVVSCIVVEYVRRPSTQILIQNLNPPPDFFEPLAAMDVDFSKPGLVHEIEWENRFKGGYSVVFAVENGPASHLSSIDAYRGDLRGELVVKVASQVVMRQGVEEYFQPFWGGKEMRGGFTLLYFSVPKDLPLATRVSCSLIINQGGQEFESRYGKTRLIVKKDSDL